MSGIISFGRWDPAFLSIILSIIFNVLNQCFYGMNNNEAFETIKFFKKSQLSNNIFIHHCFNYFSIFIIWFIFFLYDYFKNRKKNNYSERASKKYNLIHYNSEEKRKNTYVCLISLLIYFLWFVEEFCFQCFNVFFKDIDTWMIELLIFSLFNSILFKINIYKHQRLAIGISLCSLPLKIISIILTMTSKKEKYVKFEHNLPILYSIKWYILIVGWLFYIFLIFIRASVNIGLKWLIENKFIVINKILMVYGLIGSFCSLICIFLFSSFSCGEVNFEELEKENNTNYTNYNISDYICKVLINSTKEEYLTNYNYFSEWGKDWIFEASAVVLWQITFFFFKFYSIMIIKKLTPAHLIFSIPIAFFFQKIIGILYSLSNFKFYITQYNIQKIKFRLDIIGDVITFIGLLIYLEMIVLHFWGFDYNIKVNIIRRGTQDSKNDLDETVTTNFNNNEVEPILNEDINEEKDEKGCEVKDDEKNGEDKEEKEGEDNDENEDK